MNSVDIIAIIKDKGLKVTPQRVAVLEALYSSDLHPSAEDIYVIVNKTNPNIAVATIYKILDSFAENKIIRRISTDSDIMRYDRQTGQHHHLYSEESGRIVDYHDSDINRILNDYFKEKNIPDFQIENIQLQIKGKFTG